MRRVGRTPGPRIGVKLRGRRELGPWRRLLVYSVETLLDAKTGLDTNVEAAR